MAAVIRKVPFPAGEAKAGASRCAGMSWPPWIRKDKPQPDKQPQIQPDIPLSEPEPVRVPETPLREPDREGERKGGVIIIPLIPEGSIARRPVPVGAGSCRE